jgi:signal transduction histidine kinase
MLAVAFALLFTRIHPFSERFVQKRLLKTQLNYYQILRNFSNEMVTALDLRDLLKRFDQTLREAMQVTSVAIYLTGPLNGKYPLTHPLNRNSDIFAVLRNERKAVDEAVLLQTASMAATHHSGIIPLWRSGDALVAMAYRAKDVLVLGEMEMEARDDPRMQEAIVQMKEAKAEICLPLKRDGKMIGIALLGPREGDRYYSPDDLGLLHILGQNACVAVQNALLVEELKKSYLLLQRTQRLAAMGSLIAGVSHEIRNPLMPISFLMDSITDASMDKDLLARLSEHSRESLRRIVNVLDEMDQLARPYTPSFKKAAINQIADDALLLLDTQIKLRKQEVVRQYETLPPALVDSERLKHALLDILLNAVEANAENGKIYVRTREVLMKPTRTNPSRTGIQIEITDTGCGIPEKNLERVFDPFFTTKHKSLMREGTGLGLAIAHRIVEEHHGSMEIRSEEGKGTTVFVNLPVDR